MRRWLFVRADDVTTGVPEVGIGHVTEGAIVVVGVGERRGDGGVAMVPRRLEVTTRGRRGRVEWIVDVSKHLLMLLLLLLLR